MSARDNIFARIRGAQSKPAVADDAELQAVQAHLATRPVSPRPRAPGDARAEFRARALALASTMDEIAHRNEVPRAVGAYLRGSGLPLSAACWPEFADLDWAAADVKVEFRAARDNDLVGITGALCGIAETGTLMLASGSDTPATVSLLPETHIAVLPAARIVQHMEEAWGLLRREWNEMPRAVNFVSGPSRTADIEQTVTLGAHGPYRVHIIVIASV